MNHPHPFVFLRGLDSNLVAALVNFLYVGEASICKEELEQFLRAADDLKLLGLSGGTDSEDHQSSKYREDVDKGITIEEKKAKRYKKVKKEEAAFDMSVPKMAEGDVASPSQESVKSVFSPSKRDEVEEKLMSMMERLREKSEFKWRCKVCDRRTKGSKDNMRRHVEKHVDGLSYPCLQCGKGSKSSSGLKMHMVNYHRSEKF